MRHDRRNGQLVSSALVGLLGIAVLALLALNLDRLPVLGGAKTYHAEFADASGLVEGEEVRIAGIKVGKVTRLELDQGKVLATFTVNDTTIGRKTTASIEIRTLLGQHYIALNPAGSDALPYGSTIPLARTTSPMNIVPAFQRVTKDLADIDSAQLAEAFKALSTTLSVTAPEMDATLRGLQRLSESVVSRDEAIERLLDRASAVTGVVASRDHEIAELLTATEQVLSMLDDRRKVILQVIDGTEQIAQQVAGLVEDNQQQLGPVLANLNAVLKLLEKNRKQVDQILDYAHQYAKVFVSVGGTGRWLETTVKAPRGLALCRTARAPEDLAALLDPLLSAANNAVNGSNQPCLPVGPAADNGGDQ